jgi:hypothetical protein
LETQRSSPRAARLRPENDLRTLAAACDMAVLRALELVGRRIGRSGANSRSRAGALARSGKGWHEAHTVWRPERSQVDAALHGAWTVLPRMTADHGCCAIVEPDLQVILDGYVRSLVFAQVPHTFEALEAVLRDAIDE